MIHDLDRDRGTGERQLSWILPLVSALCVLGFVGLATAARTSETGVRAAALTLVTSADAPSATPGPPSRATPARVAAAPVPIAAASQPVDGGILALPATVYQTVTRLPNAVSGATAPQDPLLQYRYRLPDGRFVVLVRVPRSDPYRGVDPSAYTASGLKVRGIDARVLIARGPTPLAVLVWSEGLRAYQLSSSTHSVGELAALAEQLR